MNTRRRFLLFPILLLGAAWMTPGTGWSGNSPDSSGRPGEPATGSLRVLSIGVEPD